MNIMDTHDDPIHDPICMPFDDYNGDLHFDFLETIKIDELKMKYEEDKQDLTEVYDELLLMIRGKGSSYSHTYSNAVTPQVFR